MEEEDAFDENWDEEEDLNEEDWGDVDEGGWNHEEPDVAQKIDESNKKKKFEIIPANSIHGKMEEAICEFGEMLGVQPPYDEAKLLLQYYEWNHARATNDYFMGNQRETRINAGIDASNDVEMLEKIVECPICLDDFENNEVAALTCGHAVCLGCWSDYIKESSKNKSCFKLKCPIVDCNVAATTTRLKQLNLPEYLIAELEARQDKFRLRNYVQSAGDLNFCLGPNCTLVHQFLIEKKLLSDISCSCGYIYCIKCSQEGHRPCPCDIADLWRQKATSEAENMQWILAKTKKCPKCRVAIEKNQGCMHMTCRHCKHEFCWLCKGDWKDHGSATGGFYKCNIYEKNKKEGNISREEQDQEDAKSELERYSFYLTRFDNHISCISQMQKTLQLSESKMGELVTKYKWKPNEASFIKDAAITIIDCRRLLAWTYPIGYYMEDNFPMKDLFHQYQKDLEMYTEHLHELAEQELEVFRNNDKRSEVINYQRVIQKYRDHLLQGIEGEINPKCKFSRK